MEITCPSGLRGVVRALKGKEAQAFVDPTAQRNLTTMETVLQNCWIETKSPGPYESMMVDTKDKGPRIPWMDALLGDRFEVLVSVAVATYGSNYPIDVMCRECRKQYPWELELTDLPRVDYPEESIAKFARGENEFFIDLPDGLILQYKMGTGHEEKKVIQQQGGYGTQRKLGPVDSILAQTIGLWVPLDADIPNLVNVLAEPVEIDGRRCRPYKGSEHTRRQYFGEMDMAQIDDVLNTMQKVEGGIQTNIETICEHCGWQQDNQLPFRALFSPRKKKRQPAET